jgi:hypothetical protein
MAVALVGALAGCGPGQASDVDAADQACDHSTATELGIPYSGRVAWFTTSGGPLWVDVSDLPQDTALGDITRTRADIGPAQTPPTFDPAGSSQVGGTTHQASVKQGTPEPLDLPAGSWWLVSSNGGRVRLLACPDTSVTDVQPATAAPGDAFTNPASSEPTDEPSTPGTSP